MIAICLVNSHSSLSGALEERVLLGGEGCGGLVGIEREMNVQKHSIDKHMLIWLRACFLSSSSVENEV